jgi:hypothetical protein
MAHEEETIIFFPGENLLQFLHSMVERLLWFCGLLNERGKPFSYEGFLK